MRRSRGKISANLGYARLAERFKTVVISDMWKDAKNLRKKKDEIMIAIKEAYKLITLIKLVNH